MPDFVVKSIHLQLTNTLMTIKLLLTISLTAVMLACQTAPLKNTAATADRQEQPAVVADIPRIEPARPKIELSEDILYKILVAEIAGQRGHLDVAVENYLELARVTRDPKIVERATRVAVYARSTEAA